MLQEMQLNHYTVAIFDRYGMKVRGYDYRELQDAEAMAARAKAAGIRAEIWPMNRYGQRLAA